MATKKITPKKTTQKKTAITKIAGKVGFLAGELVAGKDHLADMAGNAIESVKSTIQHITTTGKKAGKKMVKVAPKKAAVKTPRPAAKKVTTAVGGKKTAAPKKAAKKAAKKIAGK